MRELGPIVATVGTLVAFALAIAFIGRAWSRQATAERNEAPPEPQSIRCTLPACDEVATRGRFRFVRDEGLGDFIRRAFGAAPRYRVREDRWVAFRYCEAHAHLAREEMAIKLVELERLRVTLIRDGELALGDFELAGLDARLARLVEGAREARGDTQEHREKGQRRSKG